MPRVRNCLLALCGVVAATAAPACPAGAEQYFGVIDVDRDGYLAENEIRLFVSALQPDDYSRRPDLLDRHVRTFITHYSGSEAATGITRAAFVPDCSPRPWLAEDAVPQQLHLAMTKDPSEMWVSWITNTTAKGGPPTVRYSDGAANLTATGTSRTYTQGLPLGWHGWVHHVKLTGLKPQTAYTYTAGDAAAGVWGAEHQFTTRRAGNGPTRVAVWGDQGTMIPVGYKVSDMLATHRADFDFLLHVGDLCYAGVNSVSDGEVAAVWDIWMRQNEPISANMPYMVTVGNHEGYYNFTALVNRYVMPLDPTCGDGRLGNWWWSIDHNNVHFVSLSTEQGLDRVTAEVSGVPQGVQLTWLEQDLQAAYQRKQSGEIDWIVASGHRPMYCSDKDEWGDHHEGAPFQRAVEPLFVKYGVDVYLAGHQHCYERIHPVLNGTVVTPPVAGVYHNPTAPLHVVLGTGGVFLDYQWVSPQPQWTAAKSDAWFGYGGFEFLNRTHLHYQMHELSGAVRDEFWVVRS